MITYEELHRQLNYDSLTGIFTRKISNNSRVKVGDIAGTKHSSGYIHIVVNGKQYKAHRLAWFYIYGCMPEKEIDHDDRIKHHNWISNLNDGSHQSNMRNMDNRKDNTSIVKGVFWSKQHQKWRSTMSINNKRKHLGLYDVFDNAVCARLAGEQCVDWVHCDSSSPAYKYVQQMIAR